MRTLTDQTAPTFVLLCQTMADRDTARAALADGLLVDGAIHPAATHLRQLTARCEALLARFSLSATARPAEVPKAAEQFQNPWAAKDKKIDFFQPLKGTGR